MKSNFVFKTRRFPFFFKFVLKTGIGPSKVIESGTIQQIWYGFLLVFHRNFVPNFVPFWDISLQKCRDLENRVRVRQGHRKCHRSIQRIRLPTDVLYSSISCRFWDIQCRKMSWPWNRGQRSHKVIGTDTYRSAIYDFLLTFRSNHGPVSYCFRDNRWFQSKIANFPPCI